jgi:hypothetical protein
MDYQTLNALSPEEFLTPEKFQTEYDRTPAGREAAYKEGLRISGLATEVYVNYMGTWGAHLATGGLLSSYEGIGYHAYTADLLRGFLDGPAPVAIYRYDGQKITRTVIKP